MGNNIERDSDGTDETAINGALPSNLEDVPEPLQAELRAALQARIDSARPAGTDNPAEIKYKMVMQKDMQLQSPVLDAVLKFLIKIGPPPPQKPRAPKPTGFATPEEKPGAGSGLPQPGAINPSSSGMLVWVIVIGAAAFYWIYSSLK